MVNFSGATNTIVITYTQRDNFCVLNVTAICQNNINQGFCVFCNTCWLFNKLFQQFALISPKRKVSRELLLTLESISSRLLLKSLLRYAEESGGLYIHPTSRFLLFKMSISIQRHSVSSLSRSCLLFQAISSEMYIATPPPSPTCRFLLIKWKPCLSNR